jgi:hypothetical protein
MTEPIDIALIFAILDGFPIRNEFPMLEIMSLTIH